MSAKPSSSQHGALSYGGSGSVGGNGSSGPSLGAHHPSSPASAAAAAQAAAAAAAAALWSSYPSSSSTPSLFIPQQRALVQQPQHQQHQHQAYFQHPQAQATATGLTPMHQQLHPHLGDHQGLLTGLGVASSSAMQIPHTLPPAYAHLLMANAASHAAAVAAMGLDYDDALADSLSPGSSYPDMMRSFISSPNAASLGPGSASHLPLALGGGPQTPGTRASGPLITSAAPSVANGARGAPLEQQQNSTAILGSEAIAQGDAADALPAKPKRPARQRKRKTGEAEKPKDDASSSVQHQAASQAAPQSSRKRKGRQAASAHQTADAASADPAGSSSAAQGLLSQEIQHLLGIGESQGQRVANDVAMSSSLSLGGSSAAGSIGSAAASMSGGASGQAGASEMVFDDEPLYVNAKQYQRILARRAWRARAHQAHARVLLQSAAAALMAAAGTPSAHPRAELEYALDVAIGVLNLKACLPSKHVPIRTRSNPGRKQSEADKGRRKRGQDTTAEGAQEDVDASGGAEPWDDDEKLRHAITLIFSAGVCPQSDTEHGDDIDATRNGIRDGAPSKISALVQQAHIDELRASLRRLGGPSAGRAVPPFASHTPGENTVTLVAQAALADSLAGGDEAEDGTLGGRDVAGASGGDASGAPTKAPSVYSQPQANKSRSRAARTAPRPRALLQPYQHESRHRHAMRRPRGPGGRFLTAEEIKALKQAQAEGGEEQGGTQQAK